MSPLCETGVASLYSTLICHWTSPRQTKLLAVGRHGGLAEDAKACGQLPRAAFLFPCWPPVCSCGALTSCVAGSMSHVHGHTGLSLCCVAATTPAPERSCPANPFSLPRRRSTPTMAQWERG